MNNWKKIFGIIWTGQFFSLLSSSIANFAVILWLSINTGSAAILAYAAIAGLLPQMLLSPFVGVYIDRWNRKRVMIFADAFIALCTLALVLLFAFGVVEMWHIFMLLALRSVGSTFHMPAMQASVPLLAPQEQMTRIAGINQIIASVSSIGGPALAAFFLTIWSMEYVLLLDVAGAAIAITSLLFVHIPNPPKTGTDENQKSSVLADIKGGIKAVLDNCGLSWVFLFFFLASMIYMPVSVLFPLLTIQHFGGSEFQVGFIEMLWGGGAFIGGVIMGARVYNVNRVTLINLMYLAMGAIFFIMGMLPENGFPVYAILAATGGISASVFLSAGTAVIQTFVNAAALGRVFSMFYTLSILPSLLSLLAAGFFADIIGMSTSFVLLGVLMAVVGVVAFMPVSSLKFDRRK